MNNQKIQQSVTNAFGVYVKIDSSEVLRFMAGVADAEHKTEVCIEIDGKKYEMTVGELLERMESK